MTSHNVDSASQGEINVVDEKHWIGRKLVKNEDWKRYIYIRLFARLKGQ